MNLIIKILSKRQNNPIQPPDGNFTLNFDLIKL